MTCTERTRSRTESDRESDVALSNAEFDRGLGDRSREGSRRVSERPFHPRASWPLRGPLAPRALGGRGVHRAVVERVEQYQ
jgi:hypothetical protein